jgi:hypothetical protein
MEWEGSLPHSQMPRQALSISMYITQYSVLFPQYINITGNNILHNSTKRHNTIQKFLSIFSVTILKRYIYTFIQLKKPITIQYPQVKIWPPDPSTLHSHAIQYILIKHWDNSTYT